MTSHDPTEAHGRLHAAADIAEQLRADILSGQYAPGDQLPSQPELAKRYGVARETIKRALERIRDQGLIVTRQGAGSFVQQLPETAASDAERTELALLVETIGVRHAIEILTAVVAATRG